MEHLLHLMRDLLIEKHKELNRNLIKNFWIGFSGEKYFNKKYFELYLVFILNKSFEVI
jgi:hypothetical protein